MSTLDIQRWAGKVALVTGASKGIGQAITKRLLQYGLKVVACGRQLQALETMKSELGAIGELTILTCDVSKEDQVLAMFEEIKKLYGGLDVCINNAGLAVPDECILTGKTKDWQLMFDVNVIGLLSVTREAVNSMKSKGCSEGHITNINSLAGFTVPDRYHVYAGTKHAVSAITEGLRQELLAERPNLICRVSEICPAMVFTPLAKELFKDAELEAAQSNKSFMLQAEDVAEAVVSQLATPPHVQIHRIIIRGAASSY